MEISVVNREEKQGQRLAPFVLKAAQKLWPWSGRRLAYCVCCLAAADYASTVAFLKLSADKGAYEAGILAAPALERGGLLGLLVNDFTAVCGLLLAAALVRHTCAGNNEVSRFSSAAYVFTLLPYTVTAAAAVVNNIYIVLV